MHFVSAVEVIKVKHRFVEGLSKEFVSILLSITGAVDIPMRIGNGLLADRKYVSALTHVSLCMLFASVTAFMCAAISSTGGTCYIELSLFLL